MSKTADQNTQERPAPKVRYLRAEEMAARLNVSASYLSKDRMKGDKARVPYVKFGHAVRYVVRD